MLGIRERNINQRLLPLECDNRTATLISKTLDLRPVKHSEEQGAPNPPGEIVLSCFTGSLKAAPGGRPGVRVIVTLHPGVTLASQSLRISAGPQLSTGRLQLHIPKIVVSVVDQAVDSEVEQAGVSAVDQAVISEVDSDVDSGVDQDVDLDVDQAGVQDVDSEVDQAVVSEVDQAHVQDVDSAGVQARVQERV
ncbi:hypothetical protein Q9L58_008326 [Maublancomyces gigas]|uniref:Uncharacterized protein n=1 Tax=Discina gigas TaxID=1032678 RepID=A0ABR3GAD7_9PEZI